MDTGMNLNIKLSEFKTFNDWFNSLTPEEQQEYIDDMNADNIINEQKSFYLE